MLSTRFALWMDDISENSSLVLSSLSRAQLKKAEFPGGGGIIKGFWELRGYGKR